MWGAFSALVVANVSYALRFLGVGSEGSAGEQRVVSLGAHKIMTLLQDVHGEAFFSHGSHRGSCQ